MRQIRPTAPRHVQFLFTGLDQVWKGQGQKGHAMFKEGSPIAYDAPADLKKWPSLNGQRLNGSRQPYLVFSGTLAQCIRELLAKPIRQISLYDIVTEPQPVFDRPVLSPGDAAEIAMRKDFPKD
jgi:hypothetical protein